MKKIIVMLLAIIQVLCFFISTAYAAGVPQQVLDASTSVVYIESESATMICSGSGFIIKNGIDGTYIATNNHVIEENPKGVSVWAGEDEKRSATVLAASEQYDIAIIKLSEPIDGKPLDLSANARQGDEVFAVGFPEAANYLSSSDAHLSSEVTITNGIISSIRSMKNVDYGPDVRLLQINADINAGNSGGPLLNGEGQVVGINTYGVDDSQGIFGAISSAELISFIESNNLFELNQHSPDFPYWILFACLGAIILALLIIFLPKLIGKKGKAVKELALNEYLKKLGAPLDKRSAVSLIMPVVLQLRDNHNNGTVYLKLSPSRVVVKKDGLRLRDSKDMPTDEFIAPEQRTGGFAGIRADIYGVCALLRYMLGYYYMINPETERADADEGSIALNGIIEKGLAEKAEDRFTSMQELLYELSPFNTGMSQNALEPFDAMVGKKDNSRENNKEMPEKKPRKKRLAIVLSIVGACVAVLAVFGYFAFSYLKAVDDADRYEFAEAEDLIGRVPLASSLFSDEYTYIEAGYLMINREYDQAAEKLRALRTLDGANELLNEVKYRKAAMLADNNDFDGAVGIYKEIYKYKDSEKLIDDTTFRKACCFIDAGNFQQALDILCDLSKDDYASADEKIQELYYVWGNSLIQKDEYLEAYEKLQEAGDYQDTKIILDGLQDKIYDSAVDFYHMGYYEDAEAWMEVLDGYLDSDAYITLCQAHLGSYTLYQSIKPLIGFEDASEIIMSEYYYAKAFLWGSWKGDGKYFTMASDGYISYDIPTINYGDYYSIEDGKFLEYKEKTPNTTKNMFAVTIIDIDCIQVFAYKNGRTYTLYRQ